MFFSNFTFPRWGWTSSPESFTICMNQMGNKEKSEQMALMIPKRYKSHIQNGTLHTEKANSKFNQREQMINWTIFYQRTKIA